MNVFRGDVLIQNYKRQSDGVIQICPTQILKRYNEDKSSNERKKKQEKTRKKLWAKLNWRYLCSPHGQNIVIKLEVDVAQVGNQIPQYLNKASLKHQVAEKIVEKIVTEKVRTNRETMIT